MQEKKVGQITLDLESWLEGDREAGIRVFENTYSNLVKIANVHKNRVGNITLTPNEVVHEAYTRLFEASNNSKPPDSLAFYRLAARVFRLTCIDYLRAKLAQKRNLQNSFNDLPAYIEDDRNLLQIFMLLEELESKFAKQAMAFELNKIIGFSLEETSQLTNSSKATVSRNIKFSRHWLASRLV